MSRKSNCGDIVRYQRLNIGRGKTETDYLVFNCHHSYRNCCRSLFLHRFSQSSSIFFSCFPGNADWQVTFELKHVGGFACGIPDMDTIVLTGGRIHQYVTRWDCEENIYNFMYQIMQDVTNLCVFISSPVFRYNVTGFVEELPRLPKPSIGHACAAFPDTGVRTSHLFLGQAMRTFWNVFIQLSFVQLLSRTKSHDHLSKIQK